MRAHSNALYMLNQRIKTFQMSYQRLLYALFHPDPDLDPPMLHYLSAPLSRTKITSERKLFLKAITNEK